MIPYQNDLNKAAVILKKNGGLTPEKLLEKMEGSEYISVDLNEAETKVVVELDETKLDTEATEDSDNLITSGAVYDAVNAIEIPEYTAGANVSISDANVISATDTTYTAGTNVSISSDNVISASFTAPVSSVNTKTGAVVLSASDILATNTQSVQANLERIDTEVEGVIDDLEGKLDASKSAVATVGGLVIPTASRTEDVLVGVSTDNDQMNITIGDGLTLVNNELSATGGATYTAGDGIDITNNTISVDNTIALKSEIPDVSDFATETYVDNAVATKSTVSVSATGTATDEIGYITVDGDEYKIAGGSGGEGKYIHTLVNDSMTAEEFEELWEHKDNCAIKIETMDEWENSITRYYNLVNFNIEEPFLKRLIFIESLSDKRSAIPGVEEIFIQYRFGDVEIDRNTLSFVTPESIPVRAFAENSSLISQSTIKDMSKNMGDVVQLALNLGQQTVFGKSGTTVYGNLFKVKNTSQTGSGSSERTWFIMRGTAELNKTSVFNNVLVNIEILFEKIGSSSNNWTYTITYKPIEPVAPTSNGNYVLKCTVSNGIPTLSWVAE